MIIALHTDLQVYLVYLCRGGTFNRVIQPVHNAPFYPASLSQGGLKQRQGNASSQALHIVRVYGNDRVAPLISGIARVSVSEFGQKLRIQFYLLTLRTEINVISSNAPVRMGPGDNRRIRICLYYMQARYGQQVKIEV